MSRQTFPLARTADLNVQTTGDEILVFDGRTDKAYVLNSTAAAIWHASNGKRSVPEIASHLNHQTSTTEQTVWYALSQMQDLLEVPVEIPQSFQGISRRQFLKRAGRVAAAAAVPAVISIVVPSPAHAQSTTEVLCCFYACPGDGTAMACELEVSSCVPLRGECTLSSSIVVGECSACPDI